MLLLNISLHKELTCVNFCFVLLKVFYICVRISTQFTNEWSFTCMGPKMFIEFSRGNKTLSTNATDIWLLSCMFSGMGDERTGDSKGFSTGVAHVRLLPGVATHVVGERAGLSKPLTAAIAHVGLLTTVLPVNKQTAVVCWQEGKSCSQLCDFPQISSAFSRAPHTDVL